MSLKKLSLYAVAVGVLVPTTVVALPLALAASLAAWELLLKNVLGAAVFFTMSTAGMVGLAAMWMLLFHFLESSDAPESARIYYGALLAGACVPLTCMLRADVTVLVPPLVSGWPLIGAAYFGTLLVHAGRQTSRTGFFR